MSIRQAEYVKMIKKMLSEYFISGNAKLPQNELNVKKIQRMSIALLGRMNIAKTIV